MAESSDMTVNDINKLLDEAWRIIGGKYTFHIPDVSDGNDEKVFSSFVKVRIATEGICNYVVTYEGLVKQGAARGMVLSKYLEHLGKLWTFPYSILHYMRNIQNASNSMVHFKDR